MTGKFTIFTTSRTIIQVLVNQYVIKYSRLVFTFVALVFVLAGCKSKKPGPKVEMISESYPVSLIEDTIRTSASDNTKLYPVTEEFLHKFLQKAGDYEGHKTTAKADFPEEWGIRCIERLPEGKELWFMQSQSREWMYFVITSGYGTQRILDLVPVAVSLFVQDSDICLETEDWWTARDADGSLLVTKNYEWVQSLTNVSKQDYEADPEQYHRTATYTDRYYINDMGRFEYAAVEDTVPEYSAVVFFYDPVNKPESWDDYVPRLQAFCEENDIYYEEVCQDFDQVVIRDFLMNEVVMLNIHPFADMTESGMLLLKKGEEPRTVGFGRYEYMNVAIRRYFKLRQTGPSADETL